MKSLLAHTLALCPAMLLSAPSMAAGVDYVKDIQPLLEKHCYSCHGPDKQKADLRLDVKAAAMKGGDSHAPNIIPGKGAESPLVKFVSGLDKDMLMPPKGARLSEAEVGLLRTWIDQGAVWPDGVDRAQVVDKKDWWSFKPIPALQPAGGKGALHSIDDFVSAKLKGVGLSMSPEADRRTLIRRLYLVLIGLPPTPEQVESFVKDGDPQAYEKLVDRLLQSPRYGEKWARHWLDVIAFGETHGFEVNTPRDNAWPYRDYVIEAFNKDTPYPRFILEQLAGDSVGEDRATGFMVAASALLPGQIGKDEESKAKARQDELNDMVSIAGGAFLGLTLHCARCHDHKFDPVTQADYYGLQAVFAGVRHGEREISRPGMKPAESETADVLAQLAKTSHQLAQREPLALGEGKRAPVHAHRNFERFEPVKTARLRFTVLATSENNRYEPCLDELEIYNTDGRNVALARTGAKATASAELGGARHKLEHINDGRYGNDRSWVSKTKGGGWVQIDFAKPETIDSMTWGRDRLDKLQDRLPVKYRVEVEQQGAWKLVASEAGRAPFTGPAARLVLLEPTGLKPEEIAQWHNAKGELAALEKKLPASRAGNVVYAGKFEQPGPSFRLNRGDVTQPKEEVMPTAVTAIGAHLHLTTATPEQQRRIAFAGWLADPANPLPARVLVNRLWQHQFGEGLVNTPNDFGRNGAKPSNPELLDWLAAEFIRSGWSIKHMQKLIVTSRAWKQSSAPSEKGMAADAQTRMLWRYPPRRVDAEALRDAMLQTAATLDLRMGGPGFSVFAPNYNYVRVYDPKVEYGPPEWRRAIYMTKVRIAQDSTFGAFDCPDAGQSQPKRARSTTAIQALSLFNSGFVIQQADLLARRLKSEAGGDTARQVQRAFELAFQRQPSAEEASVCNTLANEHGLPALCRVLLNANEFLFVP